MNFTTTLTHWYSIYKRSLPWRNTKNPYYIWLSEIILQQTQIKQGLPYYEAFVCDFPTVFDLANAREEQVLKLWQGLGYYSRARHLHQSAQYIVDELQGKFPKTHSDLLKLKGVGDYTASAIASICFDKKTAVVDGNVYRVLSRYYGINTPINSTQGIKEFKTLAQSLLPNSNFGNYNQAIMEFGALQCKPKNPNCNDCPLQSSCFALKKKHVEMLPVKIKKNKISIKHFNFLVFISNDKKTILHQRTTKGIWQNLYQFPLIETSKPLTQKQFKVNSEIKTLLNGAKFELSLYNDKDIIHKLSHQHLHTKFWIIIVDKLPEKGLDVSNIKTLPIPTLIENFVEEFNF
jgi:A/G-specific adenine glycosylase